MLRKRLYLLCVVLSGILPNGLCVESFAQNSQASVAFEVYKDKGGKFRFRLRSAKGFLLASSSKGFATKEVCMKTIMTMQKSAAGATIVEK